MELFDFMRAMFKPEDYEKVTKQEKAKFFFMTNRFMSIAFPIQAQAFNHIKISQAESVDYWHDQMSKLYKKTPDWMYTKAKGKKSKKKADWPSDEAVKFYLNRMNMNRKDLNDAVLLFGEEALEPIFKIENGMRENI